MKRQISVANLVMLIGGVITVVFSFFDFEGYSSFSESAWGSGFFPLATIPAILGLAMTVVCIMELVGTKLPAEVLTFNWRQIKFTWGVTAFAIMLAYLIVDKGPASLKFGGILMLLGTIAMAAGSTMAILGKGTELVNLGGGSTTPEPGAAPSAPPPPPPPPPVA